MGSIANAIVIGVITGIVTTLIGAAVWTYFLKGRIDNWLTSRARRRERDEERFQELVQSVLESYPMERDFTVEALADLINTRILFTRGMIWMGVTLVLLGQTVVAIFPTEIKIIALTVLSVYAFAFSLRLLQQGFRSRVVFRKVWAVVKEARGRQDGRAQDPAELVADIGRP